MGRSENVNIIVQSLTIYGTDVAIDNLDRPITASTQASGSVHTISVAAAVLLCGYSTKEVSKWAKTGSYFIDLKWIFDDNAADPYFRTRHLLVPGSSAEIAFRDDLEWAYKIVRYSRTHPPPSSPSAIFDAATPALQQTPLYPLYPQNLDPGYQPSTAYPGAFSKSFNMGPGSQPGSSSDETRVDGMAQEQLQDGIDRQQERNA